MASTSGEKRPLSTLWLQTSLMLPDSEYWLTLIDPRCIDADQMKRGLDVNAEAI